MRLPKEVFAYDLHDAPYWLFANYGENPLFVLTKVNGTAGLRHARRKAFTELRLYSL